jgi:hypothetical protein
VQLCAFPGLFVLYWYIGLFAYCDLCVGVSLIGICVFLASSVCLCDQVCCSVICNRSLHDFCTFLICSCFNILSITFSFLILRNWMMDIVHKYNSFNKQN